MAAAPGPSEWVSPRPWEDLASVISRVAQNMGFAQADWVLISTEAPYHKVYSLDIPLLHRLADYQMLERQLGLDERSLYHLTMNRFASRLQPPQKGEQAVTPSAETEAIRYPLLSHSAVRRVGISLRDIKLCPNCLEEEESYDRLFWRLSPVILCSQHSLLLIDRCPHCQESIPGLRPLHDRCPYCQCGEYQQAQHVVIPPTSLLHEGQTILLHLLTAEGVGGWKGPPAFIESPILRVEPWQYFALWERFEDILRLRLSRSIVVQSLQKIAWSDHHLNCESPLIRETAMHMVLFYFLLASWPKNLLSVQ
jgi:TniQ